MSEIRIICSCGSADVAFDAALNTFCHSCKEMGVICQNCNKVLRLRDFNELDRCSFCGGKP